MLRIISVLFSIVVLLSLILALIGVTEIFRFALASSAKPEPQEILFRFLSPKEKDTVPVELLIAFGGVCSTLLGIWVTARLTFLSARSQRRQHTVTSILDRRMSPEFQSTLQQREAIFPPGQEVTWQSYQAAATAEPQNDTLHAERWAEKQREGARALVGLLNYYEFMAQCIEQQIFDEELLRNTIRGIMCNLVHGCRGLIAATRKTNPNLFSSLTTLYDRWRNVGVTDINGNPTEQPIPHR